MWHTRLAFRVAILLFLAALHGIATAQPVPTGPQFRVNDDTAGNKRQPAVATDGAGNFVVVWTETGACERTARRTVVRTPSASR